MAKAYEVMTHALAVCSPDEKTGNVAAIMRDRDIGNVLVVDNGKLHGIVTDRDLSLRALTGSSDPLQAPIKEFMTTQMVTGEADWSLEKVAKTMANHQVRRLPILEKGQLVGIISLGDVARYEERNHVVSKSLKDISTPTGLHVLKQGGKRALLGIGMTALASLAMAYLTWNPSGRELRKQMQKSKLFQTAKDSFSTAIDKVNEASTSKPTRELLEQIRSNVESLSEQLTHINYKPVKRKLRTWLG